MQQEDTDFKRIIEKDIDGLGEKVNDIDKRLGITEKDVERHEGSLKCLPDIKKDLELQNRDIIDLKAGIKEITGGIKKILWSIGLGFLGVFVTGAGILIWQAIIGKPV